MSHSLVDIVRMGKAIEGRPRKKYTSIIPFKIPYDDIPEIRTKLNMPNNRMRVYHEYAAKYGVRWQVVSDAIRRQDI